MGFVGLIIGGIIGVIIAIINSIQPLSGRKALASGAKKEKNPAAGLNILLYVGSFLIITALLAFVSNGAKDLKTAVTIISTLALFFGGSILFKTVKYLKPVSKAFIVTSIIMSLFWGECFYEIGFKDIATGTLTLGTFSLFALLGSMIISTDDDSLSFAQNIGIAAYLGLAATATFAFLFLRDSNLDILMINGIIVTPILFAVPALYAWRTRAKWTPVVFRKACIAVSYLLPIFSTLILSITLLENFVPERIFWRSFSGAFLFLYLLLNFILKRSRSTSILLRLGAELFAITLIFDICGLPIFENYYSRLSNESKAITMRCNIGRISIIILGAIQALGALVACMKDRKKMSTEWILTAVGFTTMSISALASVDSYELGNSYLIGMVYWITLAVLGVLYSIGLKNVLWSIASTFSTIFAIDLLVNHVLLLDDGAALIIYTLAGASTIAIYALTKKFSPRASFWLALGNIAVFAIPVLGYANEIDLSYIGAMIVAGYLITMAAIAHSKNVLEAGCYMAAIAIFLASSAVIDGLQKDLHCMEPSYQKDYYYYDEWESMPTQKQTLPTQKSKCNRDLYDIYDCVRVFLFFQLIGGTILGVSLWREYHKTKYEVRFIIGFIGLSICSLLVAIAAAVDIGFIALGIILLVEEVLALCVSVVKKRTWLTITSILTIIGAAFAVSVGNAFIWLALIGAGMIAFVVWRLSILNTRQKAIENKNK